jgi:hypothetical protein
MRADGRLPVARGNSDNSEKENNDAAQRNENLGLMTTYGENTTKSVLCVQASLA